MFHGFWRLPAAVAVGMWRCGAVSVCGWSSFGDGAGEGGTGVLRCAALRVLGGQGGSAVRGAGARRGGGTGSAGARGPGGALGHPPGLREACERLCVGRV